jgi:hypothetical protein
VNGYSCANDSASMFELQYVDEPGEGDIMRNRLSGRGV